MVREELFKKCMTNLKAYEDGEHKLYELGINFWEREEIQNLVISFTELLEYVCKDEPENKFSPTNIEYFIYDCEGGAKADKYFIAEKDGTKIKLESISDLWDYLVKCNPEIEDKGNS